MYTFVYQNQFHYAVHFDPKHMSAGAKVVLASFDGTGVAELIWLDEVSLRHQRERRQLHRYVVQLRREQSLIFILHWKPTVMVLC